MTPTSNQPARGADALIAMRKRGVVPDVPILVSLIGRLPYGNVTLLAEPDGAYDWRAIAGLDVEVFVNRSVPFVSVLAALRDLADAVPRHMVLTFAEGPRVECGEMRVLKDFALFDWFPIAIGPVCYPEGTVIARKLLGELGKAIPIPYDEACDLVLQAYKENL